MKIEIKILLEILEILQEKSSKRKIEILWYRKIFSSFESRHLTKLSHLLFMYERWEERSFIESLKLFSTSFQSDSRSSRPLHQGKVCESVLDPKNLNQPNRKSRKLKPTKHYSRCETRASAMSHFSNNFSLTLKTFSICLVRWDTL